jgi:hypothetical protein
MFFLHTYMLPSTLVRFEPGSSALQADAMATMPRRNARQQFYFLKNFEAFSFVKFLLTDLNP